MLAMCLLLATLLLLVVLGMLGARGPHQEAAASHRQHLQALSLAQAGLEDFRAKLAKDIRFPPPPSPSQPSFSYSEGVYDVDDQWVGSFQVRVDLSLNQAPYSVFRVTSTGVLGSADRPRATARLRQEIDNSLQDRSDPTQPNPKRHQVLTQEELP